MNGEDKFTEQETRSALQVLWVLFESAPNDLARSWVERARAVLAGACDTSITGAEVLVALATSFPRKDSHPTTWLVRNLATRKVQIANPLPKGKGWSVPFPAYEASALADVRLQAAVEWTNKCDGFWRKLVQRVARADAGIEEGDAPELMLSKMAVAERVVGRNEGRILEQEARAPRDEGEHE